MGPVTASVLEVLTTVFQIAWGLFWLGMVVWGLVALGRWLARRPSSYGGGGGVTSGGSDALADFLDNGPGGDGPGMEDFT